MASFLQDNGLQKLGLLLSGIASTTSRDPRYLQTNLAMMDAFGEMKDRERMEAEREKQDLLLRRLMNPTSMDTIGTPATKAFRVNGKTYGQNSPGTMGPVMPDQMRLRSLQRALPQEFLAAEIQQRLSGPPKPLVVGAKDRVVDPVTLETLVDAQPDAAPGPSTEIGKLLAERNALPADSPLRRFYDMEIAKRNAPEKQERPWRIIPEAEAIELGLPRGGTYKTNGIDFSVVVQPKQEKPTEGEAKYAFNARRLAASAKIMKEVVQNDPSAVSTIFDTSTYLGRKATGAQTQRFQSAMADAVDAIITLGTGAAYTEEQLKSARQAVMPQPGDEPEVLADKFDKFMAYAEAAKTAGREAGEDIDIPDIAAAWRQTTSKRPNDAPSATGPNGEKLYFYGGKWQP